MGEIGNFRAILSIDLDEKRYAWNAGESGTYPLTDDTLLLLRGLEAIDSTDELAVVQLDNRSQETHNILEMAKRGALRCSLSTWDIDWYIPMFRGTLIQHLPPIDDSAHLERLVFKKEKC